MSYITQQRINHQQHFTIGGLSDMEIIQFKMRKIIRNLSYIRVRMCVCVCVCLYAPIIHSTVAESIRKIIIDNF